MKINKGNVKELLESNKISTEMYNEFIRHGSQEIMLPQIKKHNSKRCCV